MDAARGLDSHDDYSPDEDTKAKELEFRGYVSKKKDGSDRVNFTAFYEALLNAKGIELGGGSAGIGKGGRKLSYTAKVQGNGNLLVGKAYTAMLDLAPGDEFESKLGKKAIRLIPVGGEEEGEE
ncbi:AbrB family transcriptional regulator [Synechococcus sp. MIT S9503]|uniref:AbrB family transcriptional regulator n=1 Tax=Synechococcus sp. MIT S9503 TaxID=3082547 RepID=UPI0039A52176